jgi:hypothetical protein
MCVAVAAATTQAASNPSRIFSGLRNMKKLQPFAGLRHLTLADGSLTR